MPQKNLNELAERISSTIDVEYLKKSQVPHHLSQAILAYSLDSTLEGNPKRKDIINDLKLFLSQHNELLTLLQKFHEQ